MEIKYDRGQSIVLGAYASEEGKKEEAEKFYHKAQELIDKNRNHKILVIGDMNDSVGKIPISNIIGIFSEDTMSDNAEVLKNLLHLVDRKQLINFFAIKIFRIQLVSERISIFHRLCNYK